MDRQSETYRLRAINSEQRARDAKDAPTRSAWTEIAIEWHALAFRAAQGSNTDPIFAD